MNGFSKLTLVLNLNTIKYYGCYLLIKKLNEAVILAYLWIDNILNYSLSVSSIEFMSMFEEKMVRLFHLLS